MHVHYVGVRWEVTCKELTLFMQLEAKYTCGASLTPHNRYYTHSTCYTLPLQPIDRPCQCNLLHSNLLIVPFILQPIDHQFFQQ